LFRNSAELSVNGISVVLLVSLVRLQPRASAKNTNAAAGTHGIFQRAPSTVIRTFRELPVNNFELYGAFQNNAVRCAQTECRKSVSGKADELVWFALLFLLLKPLNIKVCP